LEQLCEQIARNGFKKIIVFNGHGCNRAWLPAVQRKLENKPHDYVFMIVNIHCDVMKRIAKAQAFKGFSAKDKELVMRCKDNPPRDGHAGYSETAYMMAVSPESVKMERLGIQSGESRGLTDKYRKLGVQIRDYGWHIDFPNWIDSDEPVGCNERIGQAAMKLEAVRVAHIFKRIKEDEDLLKWHNEMWDTNI
jgi:creatinine amidohydrolase